MATTGTTLTTTTTTTKAPPDNDEIITLNVKCHCGSITLSKPITISNTSFPLKSALCYCNSCRHATGQLLNTMAVMPSHVDPPEEFQTKCTAYASTDHLTRYFCPTCGATMGNIEPHEWEFTVGTLVMETNGQGRDEGMVEGQGGVEGLLNRAMMWIGDTKDGGAAAWLMGQRWAGRKRWMRERWGEPVTDDMVRGIEKSFLEEQQQRQSQEERYDDELRCQCHCGSIKLRVQRPDSGGRWPASLCACTSCRTTTGFEVTSWMHVSRDTITMQEDGSGLDFDLPGLVHYQSSKTSHRYFCKLCGAKVFYCSETRPETIDVCVGLVDPVLGARVLNWLEWNADGDNVAFSEDAVDQEFVGNLADGVRNATQK